MSRRVLALILALSMAFGLLGAQAYAGEMSELSAAEVSAAEPGEAEPEPAQNEAEESAPAEESAAPAEKEAPAEEAAPDGEDSAPEDAPLHVQSGASGTWGSNITWSLDSDGTLTISGTGKMEDANNYANLPWNDCRDDIKAVVVSSGVTHIGNRAFTKCTNLTSVILPDGVKSMGEFAFSGCTSLTGISIPYGVTSLPYGLFMDCTGLESVDIPNSVEDMGQCTFQRCSSLKSVKIPDWVKKIESSLFEDCTSLTDVAAPFNVETIGFNAFSGCSSLKTAPIGAGVKEIESNAFKGCTSLTTLKLPDSMEQIWSDAFEGCTGLKSVNLPSGLEWIESKAFLGCTSLKSVKVPKGVIGIGDYAFGYAWVDDDWLDDEEEEPDTKPVPGFTLSGYLGTAAESYAAKSKFKFKVMDKATLSSAKWDKGKKLVTVKWKKNTMGKGYQVQFSRKKNFSAIERKFSVKNRAENSLTISGVPKGSYYVRMRIAKGKNASGWSKVKTVKVS